MLRSVRVYDAERILSGWIASSASISSNQSDPNPASFKSPLIPLSALASPRAPTAIILPSLVNAIGRIR